jgi:hypothetical protein
VIAYGEVSVRESEKMYKGTVEKQKSFIYVAFYYSSANCDPKKGRG